MNRIIVLSASIFCFFGLLNAQTRVFDKQVVREKDSVKVSFKVDSQKGVPTRHKEVIMPYIHNGGDTLWFESLEIFGKERYMKERQERYLAGEKDWELQDNQVLAGDFLKKIHTCGGGVFAVTAAEGNLTINFVVYGIYVVRFFGVDAGQSFTAFVTENLFNSESGSDFVALVHGLVGNKTVHFRAQHNGF